MLSRDLRAQTSSSAAICHCVAICRQMLGQRAFRCFVPLLLEAFAFAHGGFQLTFATCGGPQAFPVFIGAYPASEGSSSLEIYAHTQVPRLCGSSFSNVIAHTPGVCPAVPSTLALDFENFGQYFDVEFWILCPEICDTKLISCNPPMYKHELFGEDLINPYRGHLVTMVRDPVQRIAASYNDPVFDLWQPMMALSEPGTRYRKMDSSGNPLPHTIPFEEFATNWTGMVTTQLTRTDWTASWYGIYLSDKDAQEAIRRLRKD
eukprot:s212_g14.t1